MPLPRDLLVLVDSREQKPLPLPANIVIRYPTGESVTHRVTSQTVTLQTGDYALCGFEKARLIERKGGAREIIHNIQTSDITRFTAAIDRLGAACQHPLLLLEGTIADLVTPGAWCKDPSGALDALMQMLDARGIVLEILPAASIHQRRMAGEWLLRRLISGAATWQTSLKSASSQTCPAGAL